MKKCIFLMVCLCLMTIQASAQDVLNEVLRTSEKTLNDTTKDMEARKVALFKFDACTYMRDKLLPPVVMLSKNVNRDSLNVRIRFLNEQTYAMSVFITLYQKRMNEASKKNKTLVSTLFKQATFDHKLFNDEDTEYTLTYYNAQDFPLPFTLDCNWVKTLAFVRSIDWTKL